MILDCQSVSKAYGTDIILDNCSFHVEEHEKTAIVGINGAGKSTLLKIIMQELPPDSGQVILSKDKTIGYLAQHQDLTVSGTIYECLLETKKDIIELEHKIRETEKQMKQASGAALDKLYSSYSQMTHEFELKNGYAWQSEVIGVLKGLGFTENEFGQDVQTLSGGQKTRISLGRLLLAKPDIILLDEPTNHLDLSSIMWLETYLLNYSGAVIIVSHDRYFLDKIVTKVVEIQNHHARMYQGNYTAFSQKKEQLRDAQIKQYYNQMAEIRHQEEVIEKLRSFNREKSIKRAESREKLLEKQKTALVDKPAEEAAQMRFTLEPAVVSGNDVLTVTGLAKSFGSKRLFHSLDFEIKRGERVALIGDNGTGKTTILKIIDEMESADDGRIALGAKVEIGYYDQEHHVLHMEKTVFDEISDAYPALNNTKIRNVLAAFLFTGEDVFKRIGELSGGERGRVSLAKLMLSNSNFLILDEPTNHLDVMSKEILEQALNRYTGTVLYVSHDRYFINRTATRILELSEGRLTSYLGNYDYYVEKKETMVYPVSSAGSASSLFSESAGKQDWKQQKEEQARIRKIKNDVARTEKRIEELEARQSELDSLLEDPDIYTVSSKVSEITKERASAEEELTELYEKWEALSVLLADE